MGAREVRAIHADGTEVEAASVPGGLEVSVGGTAGVRTEAVAAPSVVRVGVRLFAAGSGPPPACSRPRAVRKVNGYRDLHVLKRALEHRREVMEGWAGQVGSEHASDARAISSTIRSTGSSGGAGDWALAVPEPSYDLFPRSRVNLCNPHEASPHPRRVLPGRQHGRIRGDPRRLAGGGRRSATSPNRSRLPHPAAPSSLRQAV